MPVIQIGTNTGDDLSGQEDCNIKADNADTNYNNGNWSYMYESPGEQQRYLLSFSDLDTLDNSSTVNSAEIWMYSHNVSSTAPVIDCHPLLVAFTESQATWNDRVTSTAWGTSGVDITGTDSRSGASFSTTPTSEGGSYYSFTSATFEADIEDQIDGTTSNLGFILYCSNDTNGTIYLQFNNFTDGRRTYLLLDYTVGGGPTTYEVSTAENHTLSDAQSALATMAQATAENHTLSDAQTATATMAQATAENHTLSDAQAATATFSTGVSENYTLSDLSSNVITFACSVSEAYTLSDSSSQVATFTAVVSENYTRSDLQAVVATMTASVGENYTISDSASTGGDGTLNITATSAQLTIGFSVSKPSFVTGSKQLTITVSKS